MIAALELTPQDRKVVQAVGAEMLAQATRHLRLLHRSKLERDPQELVKCAAELARRERAGLLSRHRASVPTREPCLPRRGPAADRPLAPVIAHAVRPAPACFSA